jgi:hypothetical protein
MTEIPEDIPTVKLIKKYSSAIVDGFVKKAEACGALEHELTKGEIRELFVSNVLRLFLSSQFSIGTGIIINHKEEQSNQTDIIIYDNRILPPFIKEQHIGIYPAESVIGVIEVKSWLSKTDLTQTEEKMKKLLDVIYHPDGSQYRNLDQFRPLTAVIGLKGVGLGDLERQDSGEEWLKRNIKHCFFLCLVGYFSWCKLSNGWKLSEKNDNYEETKRFIAVFLDNLRTVAQMRLQLLSQSPYAVEPSPAAPEDDSPTPIPHYDWLSIYIRDQN